jgi:threonine dehydrogenase-like Zn-dependent dehydrogenase
MERLRLHEAVDHKKTQQSTNARVPQVSWFWRPGILQNRAETAAEDAGWLPMSGSMLAAYLPGDSTVDLRRAPVPEPGHGEVVIKVMASTICGSDIRCIYREHTGKGPEGYQGVIAGHEPCGQIVETGRGCRRFRAGDRVIVYHISGCGVCNDCRRGFMISCTNVEFRRAYGWQRDGGMAPLMLAEEKDLIALPDALTYADGAQVACGFGTVYEGLEKIGISGNDDVLITGLGPVGLAAGALCRKLGANRIIGIDISPERRELAIGLGLCDTVLAANEENVAEVRELTGGHGVEKAVDCSANAAARAVAIRATRKWGKMAMIGEGGTVAFNPSTDIIHDQKSIYGSWVTSTWRMEELVERLVRWNLHPEAIVTHRFALEQAGEAYALMAEGKCGKVAVLPNGE